jgi:Flp pilus assembly protein TadD
MRLKIYICLLLAVVTLAIYWPTGHYGIIYFDDPYFVLNNEVGAGLTWHSVWWALSSVVVSNWQPVTNLSFVLTHQFFGYNFPAEHRVNILFHAANAVLLYLVLNRLTRAHWRPAVVAAVFAWHPLRVESVAWIAERKDVLCGFFVLLALFFYAKEATRIPATHKSPTGRMVLLPIARYPLALTFFLLALMSKPMAVSLPLLFLILDIWPLGRFSTNGRAAKKPNNSEATTAGIKSLLFEKWPFAVLAIAMCALTFFTQREDHAIDSWNHTGFTGMIANVVSGYTGYLGKFFWPTQLAVVYPLHEVTGMTGAWLSGMLLAAITALCVLQLPRRPYLLIGWLWYIVSCIPIIGIVQVGSQSMADRYTYLPLIGPTISVVWLVAEWGGRLSAQRVLAGVTVIILCVISVVAHQQAELWQDTISLMNHDVDMEGDNYVACLALGSGYELEQGMHQLAITEARIAAKMNPGEYQPYVLIGGILQLNGRGADAVAVYRMFLQNYPEVIPIRVDLTRALLTAGETAEAESEMEKILQLDPNNPAVLNDLAWALATDPDPALRNGSRAVQLSIHACDLTKYQQAQFIGTLAAAYAEEGQFDDAITTAEKAIELSQQNHEQKLAQTNQKLVELYRAHKPYREIAPDNAAK